MQKKPSNKATKIEEQNIENDDNDLYWKAYQSMCFLGMIQREVRSLLEDMDAEDPITDRLGDINIVVNAACNIFTKYRKGDLLNVTIGIPMKPEEVKK